MRIYLSALFAVIFQCCAIAQVSLPFPGPGAAAGGPPPAATVTYNTGGFAQNDTPGGSSITFSGIAVGTASSDRYVACANYVRNGSTITSSSETIGGVSATRLVTVNNAGLDLSEIWIANVPSGSTTTIVTNYSTTPIAAFIGCWEIHHLLNAGAATSTASTTTNGGTMTLTSVPANGIVLAADGDHTSASTTWTGVTGNWDNHVNRSQSGASAAFASSQTNLAVTGTLGSTAGPTFVSVSLR